MEPTLRDGDRLLVHYGAAVRPGRLVLAQLPDRPLAVKRAVLRDSDGWWVERDNPHVGVDSWHLGAVPDSHIRAVVVRRIWPLVRRRRGPLAR
jgi:SOS-response transcriptional repressor LexA